MNEEDRKLFRELMGDITPHRPAGRVELKQPADFKAKKAVRQRAESFPERIGSLPLTSRHYIDEIDPLEVISFVRGGIQHSVCKQLRLGKMPIDATVDLHGHTVDEAAETLVGFIEACADEQERVVLISHGHGALRGTPAVLKSCLNRWLRELEAVMAFHSAQPKHGGSGATYVLLRRGKGVDDGV